MDDLFAVFEEGKKVNKKDERKAKKQAAAEARRKAQEDAARAEREKYKHLFGELPVIRSLPGDRQGRKFTRVGALNKTLIGEKVLVRARVHKFTGSGNLCFMFLRDQHFTVQIAIAKSETVPKALVTFASKIPKESLVDVTALVSAPKVEGGLVTSATQQEVELVAESIFVMSQANPVPVQITDLETPQPLLDEQDRLVAEIDSRMEPHLEIIRAIDAKGTAGKTQVADAVKNMSEKRAAVEKQKVLVQKLQAELAEAEKLVVQLAEAAEAAEASLRNVKAEVQARGKYVMSEEDAAQKKEAEAALEPLRKEKESAKKVLSVGLNTRLDNRVIDLRTTANQAIFRIQSGVCQLFREVLYKHGFVEIHSPKLISTASEGGANVFKVGYFKTSAYLAQSPQLYKQMAVNSDLQRVFEVAPVFRAEDSNTHRHMTEFVGLDMEMMFYEHYHEVLDVLEEMFLYIFDGLNERFSTEIEAVRRQFPFDDLKYKRPSMRFTWPDIIKLLRENGEEIGDYDDIGTTQEKLLGRIIKEKYDVDFYLVDKFPIDIRPFYTMVDPENPRYSNSYDFFVRGEEICSGAQRVHDPDMLVERAKHHEVDLEKIRSYIEAFKYGAYPHGGGGVGMERIVMLFLGLGNIRRSSLFPRDPKRLAP